MPFKSQAQRRKFAEMMVRGEISPETFEEWNRETGSAKLPERVGRKRGAKKAGAKRTARKKTGRKSAPRKKTARKTTARKKTGGKKTTRRRARAA